MTQAYPLHWPEGWPKTRPHQRTYSWALKRATLDSARKYLQNQLRILGARNIVLSTNIPIRNDGQPYAAMKPADNEVGVAVYFQLRGKQMVMARDSFDNVTHNLRSLGLAIEHLRGLDRHGGSSMLERAFSGFTALPPPSGGSATPTVDWRVDLGPIDNAMEQFEILALVEARYRAKAKTVHSDQGGDDSKMILLNMAIAQARAELKA